MNVKPIVEADGAHKIKCFSNIQYSVKTMKPGLGLIWCLLAISNAFTVSEAPESQASAEINSFSTVDTRETVSTFLESEKQSTAPSDFIGGLSSSLLDENGEGNTNEITSASLISDEIKDYTSDTRHESEPTSPEVELNTESDSIQPSMSEVFKLPEEISEKYKLLLNLLKEYLNQFSREVDPKKLEEMRNNFRKIMDFYYESIVNTVETAVPF